MSDDDVYLSPEEQLGEDAPGEGEEGDDLDKVRVIAVDQKQF